MARLKIERPLAIGVGGQRYNYAPGIHDVPDDVLQDPYMQEWIAAGYALRLHPGDSVTPDAQAEIETLTAELEETKIFLGMVVGKRDAFSAELERLYPELEIVTAERDNLRAAATELEATLKKTQLECSDVKESWAGACAALAESQDKLAAVETERDALKAAAAKTTAKAGK